MIDCWSTILRERKNERKLAGRPRALRNFLEFAKVTCYIFIIPGIISTAAKLLYHYTWNFQHHSCALVVITV